MGLHRLPWVAVLLMRFLADRPIEIPRDNTFGCRSPYEIHAKYKHYKEAKNKYCCRSPYEIPIVNSYKAMIKSLKLPFSLWDSKHICAIDCCVVLCCRSPYEIRIQRSIYHKAKSVAVLLMRFRTIESVVGELHGRVAVLLMRFFRKGQKEVIDRAIVAVLLMRF